MIGHLLYIFTTLRSFLLIVFLSILGTFNVFCEYVQLLDEPCELVRIHDELRQNRAIRDMYSWYEVQELTKEALVD